MSGRVRARTLTPGANNDVGSHIVFYRFTGARLDVIRILHRRMDVASHL
jgi:plasmid stabilization system protein ParE